MNEELKKYIAEAREQHKKVEYWINTQDGKEVFNKLQKLRNNPIQDPKLIADVTDIVKIIRKKTAN